MGKYVVKDAQVIVNGTDLSDHFQSVSVESEVDQVDVTGMTASAYRETADGFKTATITGTVFQDYAAGKTDATLYPLYATGSVHTVTVRPQGVVSGAGAGGTVVWHLDNARLYNYNAVSGGVGDASTFDATWQNAGSTGLTRGTA